MKRREGEGKLGQTFELKVLVVVKNNYYNVEALNSSLILLSSW